MGNVTSLIVRLCSPVALLLLSAVLAGCATTGAAPDEGEPSLTTERMAAAADEAARTGNFRAAVALYAQLLETAPTAELWYKTASAHHRLGRNADAAYAFSRCIELDPKNADAEEQLGLLYVSTRDIPSARTHLERAVGLDSKRWLAHNGLGVLADLEQDYPRAMDHYRHALEARPDSPMLHNNIGYSRYLAGDLDLAARDFMKALTLDGRYEAPRRNLGLVYARRRAYDDAVKTLVPILGEPAAYNDVGYLALLAEDYVAAEKLLAHALASSPSYYEAAARNLEVARRRSQEGSAD